MPPAWAGTRAKARRTAVSTGLARQPAAVDGERPLVAVIVAGDGRLGSVSRSHGRRWHLFIEMVDPVEHATANTVAAAARNVRRMITSRFLLHMAW